MSRQIDSSQAEVVGERSTSICTNRPDTSAYRFWDGTDADGCAAVTAVVGAVESLPAKIMQLPRLELYFPLSDWIWRTSALISSSVSLPANLGMCPLPLTMIFRTSSSEEAATFTDTSEGPPNR